MQLSMTTDYAVSTGNPEPYLKRIADAGFSHVHWCHQWNTDFLYSKWEIEYIEKCLSNYGLKLLDLHASHGLEKSWSSDKEFERLSGVKLVQNRIEMTAQLGGEVVIVHVPNEPENIPVRKSLDQLEKISRAKGIRIAIENTFNFETVEKLLAEYAPDFLGLCYDSGHGNITKGFSRLEKLKDRLISVHLHDNDGTKDLHQLPFAGTLDWQKLARIMAESSYTKPVSMESSMHNSEIKDEDIFLKKAYETGARFSKMIDEETKQFI